MQAFTSSLSQYLQNLQDSICQSLSQADGKGTFKEDIWERPEGGGGRTRIIENGNIIEKGGVNFSAVHGPIPAFLMREQEHSGVKNDKQGTFFATGISIVIHPVNPLVPIIHMNIRYFEMSDGQRWLGGGIDLTPHYVVKEDAAYFHAALKKVCDQHHPDYYTRFKEWADNYFYLPHRKETRGIGGIFFDRLNQQEGMSFEQNLAFWKEVGESFAAIYTHFMRKNGSLPFNENHKQWQKIRRGRYVEFNLVYDKGTRFGLETNGRIESILMSLPAEASWQYNHQPEKDSPEAQTLELLKKGISWV